MSVSITRQLQSLFLAVLISIGGFTEVNATAISGPAPDFTLKSFDGRSLKLSKLKGRVVLLNFWASWCGPCRQEMPLLNELYNQNKRLGFTIVGVNVEEQTKNARDFLRKYPVKFPMVMDPQNQVSKLYKIKAMPTTVVLDRDGKVRFVHHGYKPGDEIAYNKMVMQLIRE